MLYEVEMQLREEGYFGFVYDEEKDLSRFKNGRLAFSRTQADVKLLEERGGARKRAGRKRAHGKGLNSRPS
jgi:hypothetical protein